MEKLKEALIKACNDSGLHIEAIYFVMKDTFRDVENAFYQYKANAAAQSNETSEEPETVEGEPVEDAEENE